MHLFTRSALQLTNELFSQVSNGSLVHRGELTRYLVKTLSNRCHGLREIGGQGRRESLFDTFADADCHFSIEQPEGFRLLLRLAVVIKGNRFRSYEYEFAFESEGKRIEACFDFGCSITQHQSQNDRTTKTSD